MNPTLRADVDIEVEPSEQARNSVRQCSFCGLGVGEVARLFEGHAGYICDECVEVCIQLLQDYRDLGIDHPKSDASWFRKLLGGNGHNVGECNFNLHDRTNPQGVRIFPGINAQICDKCIRACENLKSSLPSGR